VPGLAARANGTNEVVPTFTLVPFDGFGAQLCSCDLATATPQTFTVASPLATFTVREFSDTVRMRVASQPRSARFGAGGMF
jgi:hypothetical protein